MEDIGHISLADYSDAICERERLMKENEELRGALKFYADPQNYKSNWIFAENVIADRGKTAQMALGQ